MGSRNRIVTSLATHVGRVRQNNEDSIAEAPDLGLLVLADGMGGHNAGEIASALATSTILASLGQESRAADGDVAERLRSAVTAAHDRIVGRAHAEPDCAGMGTTVVACSFAGGRLTLAHVGDSRAYRLRGDELLRLTRDHSLLEELIANGHYSREEAERLVRRNVVTRALGVEDSFEVDLIQEPLQAGDVYLLCSDGLTDMIDDQRIGQRLAADEDLARIGQHLIDDALAEGGYDNVSVALARVMEVDEASAPAGTWNRLLKLFKD